MLERGIPTLVPETGLGHAAVSRLTRCLSTLASLQLTQALHGPPCIYWLVTALAVAGRLPVASLLTLSARAVCHILTSIFSAQEPGRVQRGREEESPASPVWRGPWRVGTEE